MILLSTITIFFLSYIYGEVYGIEYTEKEWGLKFQIQDPWNVTSNSEKDNLCNNELKCLIVLDNTIEDQSSTITILGEKGQEFGKQCQCDSLTEFVQFDYNKSYGSLKDFSLINDNQTTLNENISAWQMEYSNINKNNNNVINHHLILWITSNDIFYKISYHGNADIYSKYLPSLKEFLNSIQFIKPIKGQETKELKLERKPPSFMLFNQKNDTKINNNLNQSRIENSSIFEGLDLQINSFSPWTIFEDSLILLQGGANNKEIRIIQNKLDTMMIKYGCKCDTLEEYARYIYTNHISKFDDFSFINDNQTTISDKTPAIQLEYERSLGDTKIHEINMISKFQDSFYQFIYYADVESFSQYLHEFKKMINTIKFYSQNESKEKQPSFMNDFEQLDQTDNGSINYLDQSEQTKMDTINDSTNKLDEIRAVLMDVDKNCNVKDNTILSPEFTKALKNYAKIQGGGLPEDWCKQGMGWLKIECDNHHDESQLCQANMPSIKKFLAREYIDDNDAEYLHNQYENRLKKHLTQQVFLIDDNALLKILEGNKTNLTTGNYLTQDKAGLKQIVRVIVDVNTDNYELESNNFQSSYSNYSDPLLGIEFEYPNNFTLKTKPYNTEIGSLYDEAVNIWKLDDLWKEIDIRLVGKAAGITIAEPDFAEIFGYNFLGNDTKRDHYIYTKILDDPIVGSTTSKEVVNTNAVINDRFKSILKEFPSQNEIVEIIEQPHNETIDTLTGTSFLLSINDKDTNSTKWFTKYWIIPVSDYNIFEISFYTLSDKFNSSENVVLRDHFLKSIKFMNKETGISDWGKDLQNDLGNILDKNLTTTESEGAKDLAKTIGKGLQDLAK